MRIVHTHHVAISTPNFDRLRQFYIETLGLPIVGGFAGHDILFIGAGSTTIELIGEDTPVVVVGRSGWHHLAWEVESVAESYAELSARGVSFHVPPEDFPPEAPSMRIAFFKDPDGNVLELVQPLGSRYPAPQGRS
jgi:catechol 2,3-dioxygenase-like lactoylglutathione lyase family enzyme